MYCEYIVHYHKSYVNWFPFSVTFHMDVPWSCTQNELVYVIFNLIENCDQGCGGNTKEIWVYRGISASDHISRDPCSTDVGRKWPRKRCTGNFRRTIGKIESDIMNFFRVFPSRSFKGTCRQNCWRCRAIRTYSWIMCNLPAFRFCTENCFVLFQNL